MQTDLFDQPGARDVPGERQTDLETLIEENKMIDQLSRYGDALARAYSAKGQFCFVPALHNHEGGDGPGLGAAIANEPGYYPVPKFYYSADSFADAEVRAEELNRDLLKLTKERALEIQISTMGGKRA